MDEIGKLAEQMGESREQVEALVREAKAAEGEASQARDAGQGELAECIRLYQEESDPEPLARWTQDQLAKSQFQAEVGAQVDQGVEAELSESIETLYGETIRRMSPEAVKALDEMPLKDALRAVQAEHSKSQATGQGEALTVNQRAEAVARAKIAERDQDQEAQDALRASIDEQIARGTEEAQGPVEEESVEEVE